jgi:ABC-type multidrug transport system permease subunit
MIENAMRGLRNFALVLITSALLIGVVGFVGWLTRETPEQIIAEGQREIAFASARAVRADTDMSWLLVIVLIVAIVALVLLLAVIAYLVIFGLPVAKQDTKIVLVDVGNSRPFPGNTGL